MIPEGSCLCGSASFPGGKVSKGFASGCPKASFCGRFEGALHFLASPWTRTEAQVFGMLRIPSVWTPRDPVGWVPDSVGLGRSDPDNVDRWSSPVPGKDGRGTGAI
ncbi:MAG: hypothetical protein QCI82_04695 [Candidatus Thermoplasmatota archaeon]|nr:hypothetical protein [Candidatus Thermoplasmatota archaeon]